MSICLLHDWLISYHGSSAGDRPLGNSSGCLPAKLEPVEGVCHPPWCVVGRVLNKLKTQEAQLILVAPGQTWYPLLLGMLRDYPRLLSPQKAQMQSTTEVGRVHAPAGHLACLREKFRNHCLLTEALNLNVGILEGKILTDLWLIGFAGVLNGTVIPFLDQQLMWPTFLHIFLRRPPTLWISNFSSNFLSQWSSV